MDIYKYDLHVHTDETSPCGRVKAKELVKKYKDAGYAGIVITDHYYYGFFDSLGEMTWDKKIDLYFKGYRMALKAGEELGLHVFPGMEITFCDSPNDYLVYGFEEGFLVEYPQLYEMGIKNFSQLARKKGFLVYQAHPFRDGLTRSNPEYLDGVEVFNGNPRHDSRNELALKFAQDNELKQISGSDFHQIEDLATGGIILNKEVSSPQELVGALQEEQIIELIGF